MREQYGSGTLGSRTSGPGDVDSSPIVASGGSDHDGHDDESEIQLATAGGFLTGAEDVVQPYSLPRPVHVVFSSPPRSPNANGHASRSPAPLTASQALAGHGTLLASANDDADVERVQAPPPFPVEDVEDLETDNMSTSELEGSRSQILPHARRIPKSMAALAAEAAEVQARATAVADDVAETPQMTEDGEEFARISRTATHVEPRTRTKTRTKTETETRTRAEAKTETKSKTIRAKSGTPNRKRARTQDDDDDDESESGRLGSELGSDGEGHVGSRGGSRAPKRARKHRHVDADGEVLAPVPASDRVLRARKGKSPARLAQERDQELAVQRALAR
jgi:xeroderma pigmentosum group C-complementing protein